METATGTVTRSNTDITSPVTVTLVSNDTTEANVPSEVTILAGQTSASFTVTAVDDNLLDGTQAFRYRLAPPATLGTARA